ncbi:MAG: hypothetical protein GY807_16755, partial [Gammaproteobacteria bacterium]|nr:hypothetical protein [Gammaproteobacteria bacterium]
MNAATATLLDFWDWLACELGALRRMRGKTRSGTKVLKLTLNGAGSPSPIELTYSQKQRTVIAASFGELNNAIGRVIGRKRIGVRIDFCEGSHVA